jgi:hypothetical protein
MKVTMLSENGLSGGIMLVTDSDPTQEELNKAVSDFHKYPVLRDTAIVVLLSPESLSNADRLFLQKIGIPGYS